MIKNKLKPNIIVTTLIILALIMFFSLINVKSAVEKSNSIDSQNAKSIVGLTRESVVEKGTTDEAEKLENRKQLTNGNDKQEKSKINEILLQILTLLGGDISSGNMVNKNAINKDTTSEHIINGSLSSEQTNKIVISPNEEASNVDTQSADVNLDYEIKWEDPILENEVRSKISKPDGAIMRSELDSITKLKLLGVTGSQIVTLEDLKNFKNIEEIDFQNHKITDLSPLHDLKKLKNISLISNEITDISPLSGLTGIKGLGLGNNRISDMKSLSSLTEIASLNLNNNQISDISTISNFKSVLYLAFNNNQIKDISPLLIPTTFSKFVWLENNPIEDWSPLKNAKNIQGKYLFSGSDNVNTVSQ